MQPNLGLEIDVSNVRIQQVKSLLKNFYRSSISMILYLENSCIDYPPNKHMKMMYLVTLETMGTEYAQWGVKSI